MTNHPNRSRKTAADIGHSSKTFGAGYAHYGALAGTLLHRQTELTRLIARRHPSIPDAALEADIAAAEAAVVAAR